MTKTTSIMAIFAIMTISMMGLSFAHAEIPDEILDEMKDQKSEPATVMTVDSVYMQYRESDTTLVQYQMTQNCKPNCVITPGPDYLTTENAEIELNFNMGTGWENPPSLEVDYIMEAELVLGPLLEDTETFVYINAYTESALGQKIPEDAGIKALGKLLKIGKKQILPAWNSGEYNIVRIHGEKGDFVKIDVTEDVTQLLTDGLYQDNIKFHIGNSLLLETLENMSGLPISKHLYSEKHPTLHIETLISR